MYVASSWSDVIKCNYFWNLHFFRSPCLSYTHRNAQMQRATQTPYIFFLCGCAGLLLMSMYVVIKISPNEIVTKRRAFSFSIKYKIFSFREAWAASTAALHSRVRNFVRLYDTYRTLSLEPMKWIFAIYWSLSAHISE